MAGPKTVTIKAPANDGTMLEVSGRIAWLRIGDQRERFLLQDAAGGEVFLVHYASGLKLGSLTPVKLSASRSYARMTDRSAAETLLEQLIHRHGESMVLDKIRSAPVINGTQPGMTRQQARQVLEKIINEFVDDDEARRAIDVLTATPKVVVNGVSYTLDELDGVLTDYQNCLDLMKRKGAPTKIDVGQEEGHNILIEMGLCGQIEALLERESAPAPAEPANDAEKPAPVRGRPDASDSPAP